MQTSDQGQTRIIGKGAATAAGPGPDVMAADTLEGDKVYTTDGDDVGKIKDIMLDVRSGRIAYAVLSSGGILGIGDKLHAIPWSALTLDTERKCFLLSVSSERIRNAPGFDKDHWPAMADPQWAEPLHEFYGSAPYWSAGDELGLTDPTEELNDPRARPSLIARRCGAGSPAHPLSTRPARAGRLFFKRGRRGVKCIACAMCAMRFMCATAPRRSRWKIRAMPGGGRIVAGVGLHRVSPFPARGKPIAAQAAPPPDCMRHAGCCVVRIVDTECFMRAMQFLPSGLLASARATARSPRCSAQQRHAAAPTCTWGVA